MSWVSFSVGDAVTMLWEGSDEEVICVTRHTNVESEYGEEPSSITQHLRDPGQEQQGSEWSPCPSSFYLQLRLNNVEQGMGRVGEAITDDVHLVWFYCGSSAPMKVMESWVKIHEATSFSASLDPTYTLNKGFIW